MPLDQDPRSAVDDESSELSTSSRTITEPSYSETITDAVQKVVIYHYRSSAAVAN
jgi:hypothetical protein